MNYQTLVQELEQNLGLTELSQEAKETVFQKLGETIVERILLSITATLTEEESREATSLLKEGDLERTILFLTEKHPELDAVAISICNEVTEEFLNA